MLHVGASVVAAVVEDGALDGQHARDVARGGPQDRLHSEKEEDNQSGNDG